MSFACLQGGATLYGAYLSPGIVSVSHDVVVARLCCLVVWFT